MKNGMARRGNPVVLEYILAGIIHRTSISPRTTKKIAAVKPMETAMGSPIIIKKIKVPKMAKVIMPFSLYFRVYFIDEIPPPPFSKEGLGGFKHYFLHNTDYYFFLASSTYFINVLTLSSPAYLPILS
jgi:hypothetical protein